MACLRSPVSSDSTFFSSLYISFRLKQMLLQRLCNEIGVDRCDIKSMIVQTRC